MKLSKKQIQKILSDDVLIYAHRRNLWKNGITPKFKISNEVIEFIEFLKSHNVLENFIDYFNKYHLDVEQVDNVLVYKKSNTTLFDYFEERPAKFFLKGAFEWKTNNHFHIWFELDKMWNEQIKNR